MALHGSETGVFYQAMPAVGADGKNIMKLIPVRMVNGQYHQTTQKSVSLFNPLAPGHVVKKFVKNRSTSPDCIRKPVSTADISDSQQHPARRDSVNRPPPSQQAVNHMVKVPPTTPHSLSHQLPVTVKSPALPRGQFLKIPPNAQVQRVPASELPPAIKDQIFTSSSCSSAGSVPTVVYVSPVATVNQGVTEPSGSMTPPLKLQSNTKTPRGLKPQLKLVPKVPEGPNSPIRWVIEEVESYSAETLKTFSPEDLQPAAETDNLHRQVENALVMYNGRVFFVTNKSSSSFKSSAATQSIVPSLEQSHDPDVLRTRQNLNNAAEVIDLCDDDDVPEDSHHQAPSSITPTVSPHDEENVIFVSYIPPKSGCGSTQVDQTGSNSRAEILALREGRHGREDTDVCGSAETQCSDTQSQWNISDQQLDNMQVDAETGSSSRHSSRIECGQTSKDFKHLAHLWTFPPHPEPCSRSDHQLRKIFGIKSDVKICLQKVDEAAAVFVSTDSLKTGSERSAEDDEKQTNSLKQKEPFPQNLHSPKTLTEHEPAALHTRTSPPSSSGFKLNPKPSSVLKESCCSGHMTPQFSEAETVIGYVEPIDEDFPDESDIHPTSVETTPHLPTQTCADSNTFTRRMGRTRKRTMCPCCVPAALHPAVKSGLRLEELEAWMLITEQAGKKPGRTKSSRKDGRTSVKISYRNCKIHKTGGDGLSSASTDPDNFSRHEHITRHKDAQAEKDT